MKSTSLIIMKDIEQHFPVVSFIMRYKMVLPVESMDEIKH